MSSPYNSLLHYGVSASLTTEYPATVGNLFMRIRRSLQIDARLNREQ